MYGLIVILVAFLTIAFFGENKQKEENNKIPRVGVLTLMRHPALDEIYRGFRDE